MRGATNRAGYLFKIRTISIHAPHARSDAIGPDRHDIGLISIHAPHARSDAAYQAKMAELRISIHAPHARSDLRRIVLVDIRNISIHAPHARSDDPTGTAARWSAGDFNPRSSCEERRRR